MPRTKKAAPAWRASTLFAITFGTIAHQIKTGRGAFKTLQRITIGMDRTGDGETRPNSTLIQGNDGQWFRLTVEPVKAPARNWIGEWQVREEPIE